MLAAMAEVWGGGNWGDYSDADGLCNGDGGGALL